MSRLNMHPPIKSIEGFWKATRVYDVCRSAWQSSGVSKRSWGAFVISTWPGALCVAK